MPPGLAVRLLIIDNDGETDLAEVHRFIASCALEVVVLHELRPGKSSALNAALELCTAEYVAFLDDDEEVEASWFEIAARALAGNQWDFIGGRSLPLWRSTPPEWLPHSCPAVLGIVDSGPVSQPYGPAFPGMLTGGNAIVRLSVLRQLGGFVPELGPSRTHRLLSGEDEDLYGRLLASGAVGLYLPDLIVWHHIHPDRLHKRYYRSWFFWNGTAKGLLARRRREPVPHLLGAPRYLFGRALRSAFELAQRALRLDLSRTLDDEAPLWLVSGFLYGRYVYRDGNQDPAESTEETVAVRQATAL